MTEDQMIRHALECAAAWLEAAIGGPVWIHVTAAGASAIDREHRSRLVDNLAQAGWERQGNRILLTVDRSRNGFTNELSVRIYSEP